MKIHSFFLLVAVGGAALLALAAPESISGQDQLPLPQAAPASNAQRLAPAQPPPRPVVRQELPNDLPPQVAALIKEVSAQAEQIAANQTQIDAKLDQLAETVRQSRLFAARGGGKGVK